MTTPDPIHPASGDLEAVARIIDANKYEAWTVDRANQMAAEILAAIRPAQWTPAGTKEAMTLILGLAERGYKTPGMDSWRAVDSCRRIATLSALRPDHMGDATTMMPASPPATAAEVGEAYVTVPRQLLKDGIAASENHAKFPEVASRMKQALMHPASHDALIARVRELEAGLDEIGVWYAEAPNTFPDWKTAAEAMAQMAENVRDGHPALSTPESRALLTNLDARDGG